MANDTTYNGWTNYETWNVNLWLSNDEGSYRYWNDRAQELWDAAEAEDTFTKKERATLDLADSLQSEHELSTPDVSGVYADLLNSALSEVNWYEIATGLLEDFEEEKKEEEEADDDA